MPVQYPSGILAEHLHCRQAAALFDVSHMGQVRVAGAEAATRFERLVPGNIQGLKPGQGRYTLFTTDEGGILDDPIVSTAGDHLFAVVNAGGREADLAHMRAGLEPDLEVQELADRALLALQGPAAAAVMAGLAPESAGLSFMTTAEMGVGGLPCRVSRLGYTGEDGFEISVPAERAVELARLLLGAEAVRPAGLGARDSLRLEAGLCLYGHDIDTTTTPVEAALEWSIQKSRRSGGVRAGGFPGADEIIAQLQEGAPRRRVGLRPEGRAPVRERAPLYADQTSSEQIGAVTSGGFGPSLNAPVAMGYLPLSHAALGTAVFAEVRGQRLLLRVTTTPFVRNTYKR